MKILAPVLLAASLLAAPALAVPLPGSLADLAAKVSPAVVSVASVDPINGNGGGQDDPDGGDQGGHDGAYHPTADHGGLIAPPKADEALGTGFVFDPAGYILTNNHVIHGASAVTVTFQDGTILPATIVGIDKDADLAVLKIDAGHPLPYVKFGDSTKLRVGDWVLAIGNPFGLPGSTSAGIVSALDRNIGQDKYDDFIQTDATINRGNSGGPMFDMAGEVVGVNAAMYSPSGGSVGIGFAIPSAMAAPVAAQLKTNGAMIRGWLGVASEDVIPPEQALFGLPDTKGALIGAVSTGSPADGVLQPGDVLTALAGVPIANPRALFIRTAEVPAGMRVPVAFWRDGSRHQADIAPAVPPAKPDDSVAAPAAALPSNVALAGLGLSVSATPAAGGLTIVAVTKAGPAAKAGLVAGDVIEQVAGQPVGDVAGLQAQLKTASAAHEPAALFLISGDTEDGNDPGPRWVPVTFAGK
jgi:serine protease Do/2-alkenal reductase